MATRPQIQRLAQRIESIVGRRSVPRFAVIYVGVDETVEAATERHYAERPEDRNASDVVVVQYVAAIKGRPAKYAEVTDHGR
jgi:hypothetical protein